MLRSSILLSIAIGIASAVTDFTPLPGTTTYCEVRETVFVNSAEAEVFTSTIPLAEATNIPGEVCVRVVRDDNGVAFTTDVLFEVASSSAAAALEPSEFATASAVADGTSRLSRTNITAIVVGSVAGLVALISMVVVILWIKKAKRATEMDRRWRMRNGGWAHGEPSSIGLENLNGKERPASHYIPSHKSENS